MGLEQAAVASDGAGATRPARAAVGTRVDTLAAKTTQLYAGDWARFAAFCARNGAPARPASSATVIAFLQGPGVGRTAGRRWLAAIDHHHHQHGMVRPGDDEIVRRALKQARKTAPRRPRPKPPTMATLSNMARRCRRDLAGLRDRAVLLLLAAGLSRGTLVALQAESLRWTEDGIRVDRQTLQIARAGQHDLCPVRALEEWLRASDTRYGPVFRKVTRWRTIEPAPLGADAVRRILARYSV